MGELVLQYDFKDVNRLTGNYNDIVIASLNIENHTIDITYDFKTDNVIVSHWYLISADVVEDIMDSFRELVKEKFGR